MASLLDHSFPLVPEEYDPGTFARIMRDLEMALTKFDFPAVMSGEDDTKGFSWFMEQKWLQRTKIQVLWSVRRGMLQYIPVLPRQKRL